MDYTKKPVTIQAIEWTGENKDEIKNFVGDAAKFKGKGLLIATLEGDHKATKGDMIIRGVQGEFYPCKPDIFAETYNVGAGDGDVQDEPMESTAVLPEYVSHKVVRAGKIESLEQVEIAGDDQWRLMVDNYGEVYVPFSFYARGVPEGDLGYLMQYKDGYQSWTPTEPFIDGYSLVGVADDRSEKTFYNSSISGARDNVPDIAVVGNGDAFKLLCKASSQREGWMKSTKAMQVAGGALVQVTTQQRNPDGSYAVAEALAYVPGGEVVDDVNGGRKLKGNR